MKENATLAAQVTTMEKSAVSLKRDFDAAIAELNDCHEKNESLDDEEKSN